MATPFTYRQVKDLHQALTDTGAITDDLPTWSRSMGDLFGSSEFQAGQTGNWIKDLNIGLNKSLEDTGLVDLGGDIGEGVGSWVGAPEIGRAIGAAGPRGVVNFLPMLAAGPVGGAAAIGALAGSDTYTESGKPAVGVTTGLISALMPGVGGLFERGTLKALGAPTLTGQVMRNGVAETVSRTLPQNLTQGILGQVGANVGAGGFAELGSMVQAGMDPDEEYQFSPTKFLLDMTLGQAPFAGIYATKGGMEQLGGKATRRAEAELKASFEATKKIQEVQQAQSEANQKTGIEQVPDYTGPAADPTTLAKINESLADLRGRQRELLKEATPTSMEEFNRISQLEEAEIAQAKGYDGSGVMGVKLAPETKRTTIIGEEHFYNPETGFRMVKTPDGKIIGYSTLHEPPATPSQSFPGKFEYSVPEGFWSEWKDRRKPKVKRTKPVDTQTPELPIQEGEAEGYFDHVTALAEVGTKLDAAKTTVELQDAIVEANNILAAHGFPGLTDARIAKRAKVLEITAQKAAKAELAKLTKAMDARLSDDDALRSHIVREEGVDLTENLGKKDGQFLPKLPKLNAESFPVHDFIDDLTGTVQATKDAEQAFGRWNQAKTVEDQTSLPVEKERYAEYLKLVLMEDIQEGGTLSDQDAKTFWESLDPLARPKDWKVLKDFPERDHVMEWHDMVDQYRTAGPATTAPWIPAGEGFVWGVSRMFREGNRVSNRKTLRKDGTMSLKDFEKAETVDGISSIERELYRSLVPEAFGKDSVNVNMLMEGLSKREPVVEVKKLGSGVARKTSRTNEIQHELDTILGNGWGDRLTRGEINRHENARVRELYAEFEHIRNGEGGLDTPGTDSQDARYAFLGPKSQTEMPGYVEGLVRVPYKDHWRQLDVKYRGPHFGEHDTNVLAFFRGYEETLPDGRKAFHVIEVQSDWGQDHRNKVRQQDGNTGAFSDTPSHPLLRAYETLALKSAISHAKSIGADTVVISDAETAMMTEGHDRNVDTGMTKLSKSEHNIQLANDVKVQKLAAASDDIGPFFLQDFIKRKSESQISGKIAQALKDLGFEVIVPEPIVTQEGGMRLHYDQTLPARLSKLVGKEGVPVEMGIHKGAGEPGKFEKLAAEGVATEAEARQKAQNYMTERGGRLINPEISVEERGGKWFSWVVGKTAEGSPVLKNADGTPKSSITGRSFDISTIPAFDQQGGFTLGESSRAPAYEPRTPEETQNLAALKIEKGIRGQLEYVMEAMPANSWQSGLARDLVRDHPELLSRMAARVVDEDGPSNAYVDPRRRFGGTTYRKDVIYGTPQQRANIILHEALHQLTLGEMLNPTKKTFVDQLEGLRNRIIDGLPEDMRTALNKAVEENFLAEWGSGRALFSQLHPDLKKAQIIYGLLNNFEFVTQGFTSKPMRDLLMFKEGKKQGWWNKFTGFIKNLLGANPQQIYYTALDELMQYTAGITTRGEKVATLQNFAERFFEGKGYRPQEAMDASNRVLSIAWGSGDQELTGTDIIQHLLANPLRTTAVSDAAVAFAKMDPESVKANELLFREFGYEKADPNALMQDILLGQDQMLEGLAILPDEAANLIFVKARQMKDVVDGLKAAASKNNRGYVDLAEPDNLVNGLATAEKQLNKILKFEKLHQEGQVMIQNMAAVEPRNFFSKWSDPKILFGDTSSDQVYNNAPDFFQDKIEGTKGFFKKLDTFFRPTAQYADARLREAFSYGYQLTSRIRRMTIDSFKAFSLDPNNEYTTESVKKAAEVLTNQRLLRPINKWIYENQKAGKESGSITNLRADDPRVAKYMEGLSAEERKTVQEFVTKHEVSKKEHDRKQLEIMKEISVLRGAKLIGYGNELKLEQNMALSKEMWDSLNVDWQDPAQAMAAEGRLAQLQTKIAPDQFADLLQMHRSQLEGWQEYQKFLADNPNWSSAQRTGKYRVRFWKDGKQQTQGVDSWAEADMIAGGRKNIIGKLEEVRAQGDEEVPSFGSDYQQIFERLQQLEENQLEMMRIRGADPEEIAFAQRTGVARQFARETAGQGLTVPVAPARGLTRGAEDLPWLSNHFSWLNRSSSYWSKRWFREQMDAYIAQKEIPQEQKELLRTHRDNMLQADPEAIKNLNDFTRTWFLGYSAANAIINTVQPFTTHVAEITSITGKPLESYRRVMSALKEVGGHKWRKNGEWSDPEIARLMKDALDDGEVGLSAYDDEKAAQSAATLELKKAADSWKPKGLGDYLRSAAGAYTTGAMWLFSHGEQVNNRIALITGFKLAKEKGLSYEEARKFAYDFNHRVNFGGGKAQRPIGMFSGRSPVLRGAAMLASSMQSYVLGTTFQIARYLKSGLFRPKGLTPHEVYSARKAGLQMLATQFAAAGLLGLPFVSGILSLLDKTFPELEANKNVREFVSSFFGSDNEDGGILSDIAMTGVPSMLGWDMQSRLSMGNTVPGVSEYNGFQPEQLLGAPLNMLRSFFLGGTGLLKGDEGAMRQLTPSAFKKLTDLVGGEGKLKDYRGREILQPTPGESLGVALGFQPKRLSDFNAAQRMAELSEKNARDEKSTFHQGLAEELLKGNYGAVRQQLVHQRSVDSTYNPDDGVRAVARIAEELSFPRDLRREGTGAVRSRLLQSFSLDRQKPSELNRLKLRSDIERKFGLPGATPEQVRMAQLMDQISAQKPQLSRTQIRAEAERLLKLERRTLLQD